MTTLPSGKGKPLGTGRIIADLFTPEEFAAIQKEADLRKTTVPALIKGPCSSGTKINNDAGSIERVGGLKESGRSCSTLITSDGP
jgi:hypothetical protein